MKLGPAPSKDHIAAHANEEVPPLPPGEGGGRSPPDEGPALKRGARVAREPSPQPLSRRRGGACTQVALFRERKDANASAARLRRLGYSVACLPVIEIRTRPVRRQRSHYDAVIATSYKAFDAHIPPGTTT